MLVTVDVTVDVPVAVVTIRVGALLITMLIPVFWSAYSFLLIGCDSTSLTSDSLENDILLDECTDEDWEIDNIVLFVDIDVSSTLGRETRFH